MRRLAPGLLCLVLLLAGPAGVFAQTTDGAASTAPVAQGPGFDLSLNLGSSGDADDVSTSIQLVLLMTLLTLAPAIVLLMTSFMRIVIVLGFLRNAMGLQSIPPNQVVVGIAIFLTFFIMKPVGDQIYQEAFVPLQEESITSKEAMDLASVPLKDFMLRQTRPSDVEFFLDIAQMPETTVSDLPMRIEAAGFRVERVDWLLEQPWDALIKAGAYPLLMYNAVKI